jgi:osmotically-inducible protein OsmY
MRSALRLSISVFAFTGILACGVLVRAQDAPQAPPPDNTKTNERDRKASEPTADQQDNDRSDREITQQIRQLVVKDKSLSTYAHNVKIIAQDGKVTLKGPVRSDSEKHAIEAKAAQVVGQDKVTSELAVAPKK